MMDDDSKKVVGAMAGVATASGVVAITVGATLTAVTVATGVGAIVGGAIAIGCALWGKK